MIILIFLLQFQFGKSDGEVRFNPTDMHAANYHVMGVDLRHLDEIENKLKQAEVDFSLPTLFLAECVLVYIESVHCSNLLKWLSSHFSSAYFVNYEQVNMNDRFGEVMLSNLRSRGCDLQGVDACQTLDTQVDRLAISSNNICFYVDFILLKFHLFSQIFKLRLAWSQSMGHGASVSKLTIE